jgi:predicted MFS family arabinose efflux permease
VFVAGALAALAPLAVVGGLPTQVSSPDPAPATGTGAPLGVLAGLRTAALVRPAVVFAATAMASGAVVTFLPAAAHASATLVAVALLLQSTAATVSRWWAGRHGDRHGPARLLVPAGLLVAVGLLGMAVPASPLATLAGAALFGAGFGIAQNASLALMFQQAPASAYGTVSAVWNLAYDAGLGLGAAGFGALAAHTGIPGSFVVTAAATLATLVLARRGRIGRTAPIPAPRRG